MAVVVAFNTIHRACTTTLTQSYCVPTRILLPFFFFFQCFFLKKVCELKVPKRHILVVAGQPVLQERARRRLWGCGESLPRSTCDGTATTWMDRLRGDCCRPLYSRTVKIIKCFVFLFFYKKRNNLWDLNYILLAATQIISTTALPISRSVYVRLLSSQC